MKSITLTALGSVLLATLLAGCATPERKGRVLVCPECQDVSKLVYPNQDIVEGLAEYEIQHQCVGCRGAVENFYRDGAFTHSCSICRHQPWSCELKHRS